MFWCSGDFDVGKQLCEENEKCVIYVDLVENGFLLAKVAGGPGLCGLLIFYYMVEKKPIFCIILLLEKNYSRVRFIFKACFSIFLGKHWIYSIAVMHRRDDHAFLMWLLMRSIIEATFGLLS